MVLNQTKLRMDGNSECVYSSYYVCTVLLLLLLLLYINFHIPVTFKEGFHVNIGGQVTQITLQNELLYEDI